MLSAKSRDIDMTTGSILPLLIRFTVPLIITNLLQVSYNVADSVIVSYSPQPDAVGAVGTTAGFINLMVNIFIGCSVGAKVLVAGRIGAKQHKGAQRGAATGIGLSLILGILCAVTGCIICRPLLAFMGNKGTLLKLAVLYTCIYFAGVPFIALTNFAIALIHARGDTRTPLYVLSATGLLNVVLNGIFVFVFNMSVEGVALASVIANAASAIFLTLRAIKAFDINIKDIRLSKAESLSILKIGMPAGIQGAVFSLSHMMIQSSVVTVNNLISPANAEYAPVVKGCAACTNIESFASTTIASLCQVAISFVSQNYGAWNFERIQKIRRVMYGFAFVVSTLVAWTLIALAKPLLSLFNIFENGDILAEIAYASAITRMKYMFIPYFLLGFMEVGAGVVQGLKRSVTAAITSLTGSCLLRIVWILTVFKMKPELEMVFITFPISWLVTAAAHYITANIIIAEATNTKSPKNPMG